MKPNDTSARTPVWALCACLLAPSTVVACLADGAFGFSFGSKPPVLEKLDVSEGSVLYSARSPEADARFDSYTVRLDSANQQLFEVSAVKRITKSPAANEPGLSPRQQEEGSARSRAFAIEYIQSLPQSVQQAVTTAYAVDMEKRIVPEGHVFVLGDNRDNSRDKSCLRSAQPHHWEGGVWEPGWRLSCSVEAVEEVFILAFSTVSLGAMIES